MAKWINLDDPEVTYSHNLGNHEVYIVGTEAERIDLVRCGECKYYEGVPYCMGHAPCSYWKSGGVLWKGFCSCGERRTDDE